MSDRVRKYGAVAGLRKSDTGPMNDCPDLVHVDRSPLIDRTPVIERTAVFENPIVDQMKETLRGKQADPVTRKAVVVIDEKGVRISAPSSCRRSQDLTLSSLKVIDERVRARQKRQSEKAVRGCVHREPLDLYNRSVSPNRVGPEEANPVRKSPGHSQAVSRQWSPQKSHIFTTNTCMNRCANVECCDMRSIDSDLDELSYLIPQVSYSNHNFA